MTRTSATFLVSVALAALPGCGGDDEDSSPGAEPTGTTTVVEKTEPGDSRRSATTEDSQPEENADEGGTPEPKGGEAGPGDSEDAGPGPETVDVEALNALKLGTSLEDVLDALGTEPVNKQPGPGGTTCYEIRVRPGEAGTTSTPKALRAQLCFRNGKLRGTSLVTEPDGA